MNLQLRFSEEGSSGGVYVLTDENGHPLPGQRSVKVKQHWQKPTKITVTFVVDGTEVRVTQESVIPGDEDDI